MRPETKGDPGRPLAPPCDHFVILSMQRSGSREAEKILNNDQLLSASMRVEGEYFNFGKGPEDQPGASLADSLKVTPDEVRRHGVQWWSQKVFESLEQVQLQLHGAQSPCAVGFRAFENPDVYGSPNVKHTMVDFVFNHDELKPLLEDSKVKKIILERRNTTAQWFSLQRACRFGDWSDHHGHDEFSEQLERIKQCGKCCGPPVVANKALFHQTKHDMYRRWYNFLDRTSQPYVSIKTEDLDTLAADPSQLREFLFPSVHDAAS
jgi:hypothetical protein